MINKDYIMMSIEQFVKALLSIISARKVKNYEEAYHQIQNASQLYLGKDFFFIMKCSPEGLLGNYKNQNGHVDVEKCMICADLLYEMALICENQAPIEVAFRIKVLCLYLYVKIIPMEKQFQTNQNFEKVKRMKRNIDTDKLSDKEHSAVQVFEDLFSKK